MSGDNIVSPDFEADTRKAMQEHVWVLFALEDISKYFEEKNLPKVAAVIEHAISRVEAELFVPPSKTAGADGCRRK